MGILGLLAIFWREKEIRTRKEDFGKVTIKGALGLGVILNPVNLKVLETGPKGKRIEFSFQRVLISSPMIFIPNKTIIAVEMTIDGIFIETNPN
jgi:hypothetical protein